MREIKFRAWDVFYNKFLYSNEGNLNGFFHAVEQRPESERLIQQFTGLHDKNGKEIYEGDVVEHGYAFGNGKGVVEYLAPNFTLSSKDGVCDEFLGRMSVPLEIIGNLYENPELLNS